MTELQQNRYDQLLRRVGDLKGPGSKVNDALTELFPMFDVENVPAELLLLAGTRLCMAHGLLAAGGATFFNTFFLRNPGSSGIVARVTSLAVTQQSVLFGPSQNSSTALGGEAFADSRVFGQGTTCKLQGNNNFLIAGGGFYQMGGSGLHRFEPPAAVVVLAPGSSLQVSGLTVDTALEISVMWVERVAQPSELNL